MGGFAMIIFSCLIINAEDCREDEVRVSSLFSCAIHGQVAQAAWLKKNPGRRVVRWVCDPRQLAKV